MGVQELHAMMVAEMKLTESVMGTTAVSATCRFCCQVNSRKVLNSPLGCRILGYACDACGKANEVVVLVNKPGIL